MGVDLHQVSAPLCQIALELASCTRWAYAVFDENAESLELATVQPELNAENQLDPPHCITQLHIEIRQWLNCSVCALRVRNLVPGTLGHTKFQ